METELEGHTVRERERKQLCDNMVVGQIRTSDSKPACGPHKREHTHTLIHMPAKDASSVCVCGEVQMLDCFTPCQLNKTNIKTERKRVTKSLKIKGRKKTLEKEKENSYFTA